MSEIFKMTRDQGGYNGFGLLFTSDNYNVLLPATTDTSLTVPDNYPNWFMIVRISSGGVVYVNRNNTAAIPTTGSFVNNSSILNPGPMQVFGGDVIHFNAHVASTYVGVTFYAIQFL